MKTRSVSLTISPDIGKVSAELTTPANPVCILAFAHGAGAGMNHEFMVQMSQLLAEKNIATLRFNFPFMEKGKGRPDSPAVAHKAIEAAIKKARSLFPALPLFASGKSFGGRMSSQYLASQPAVGVNGIIFFGFPLHQSGKPSIERAEHLKSVTVPMLFLQGSRDELASYDLIEKVCRELPLATLVKIEGANHAFKAGKQEVMARLADETKAWIDLKIPG
ncbi:MAG TPA: alpha/beta family hydrolase [Flavitalea sp.]|nr:alpha/beta family hydrolase [Flavitalea sp.]